MFKELCKEVNDIYQGDDTIKVKQIRIDMFINKIDDLRFNKKDKNGKPLLWGEDMLLLMDIAYGYKTALNYFRVTSRAGGDPV